MDLATAWAWAVERHPTRRAVGGPRPMTYAEWDARTARLAHALTDLGVRPGDRVALVLIGGEPAASLHLALQRLGAIAAPLSHRFGPPELAHCLADAAPALVVSEPATAEATATALADERIRPVTHLDLDELERRAADRSDAAPLATPGPDDLSVMLFTSGTTGRPKGVPRTHRAEHAAAVAHLVQTGQRSGEVALGVMPLFHTMGLRTLLATVLGGRHVGAPGPVRRRRGRRAHRPGADQLALPRPDDVLVAAARRRPGRARGRAAARLRGRGDGAGAGRAARRGGRPGDVRQPLRLHRDLHVHHRPGRRGEAGLRGPGRGCSAGSVSSTRRPGPPPTPRSPRASRGRWSCRWRARRPSPATGCGRTPPSGRSATAGTSPATSPWPTTTATCGSPGASTT